MCHTLVAIAWNVIFYVSFPTGNNSVSSCDSSSVDAPCCHLSVPWSQQECSRLCQILRKKDRLLEEREGENKKNKCSVCVLVNGETRWREKADTGELWRRCAEMSSHKFGSEKEDHRPKQFVRLTHKLSFFF